MTMIFHDAKVVNDYLPTSNRLPRRETISHYEKTLKSSHMETQYLHHRRHRRSPTHKNKIKKVMMIDACQPPPTERPFSAPLTRTNTCRSKNFLVRVYRNGDDSMFAQCASCTMDIILSDATRKLQMIRPAQRLFDYDGHEIFRSEHIQRDMAYYVSEGEDYISPFEAIKSKLQYSLHSRWTIHGIESSYIIERPRRQRRRRRSRSINSPEPPSYTGRRLTRDNNKDTQTTMACENKDIQTDGNLSLETKTTQTITKSENKIIQTDDKISTSLINALTQTSTTCENKDIQTDERTPLTNKDTQTIMKIEHRDIQTDAMMPLEHKDTQTITKSESKDIQTDGNIALENKVTQTITEYENKDTQTDELILPPPLPNTTTQSGSDQTKPNQMESEQTTTVGIGSNQTELARRGSDQSGSGQMPPNQTEPVRRDSNQTGPGQMGPNQPGPVRRGSNQPESVRRGSNQPEPVRRGSNQTGPGRVSSNQTEPGRMSPKQTRPVRSESNQTRPRQVSPNQLVLNRSGSYRTGSGESGLRHTRPTETVPVASSLDVIYRRPNTPTNFRVKVYRNGEHERYAYCKSCSMDIILSSATQKLQMSMLARRLFDADGIEIFHSRDIQRDAEYFVSSGGNFKRPSK